MLKPQVAKLQRISPTDQTSQLKESVQVLENNEASEEAESVALMAEIDRPSKNHTTQRQATSSRIRIVPDDHHIFAGLPDIIALPDLGSTCLMHGSRKI
ncbi:hypothetical protein M0R45_028929 [Rubus argutus]|uniref:Uncharacterized protein n=1 Tax=Rubus argutus TaxID=59490 RepID=A0AAW1W8P8_RUBAR